MSSLNPGLILILGALPIMVLPQWFRRIYLLALPLVGLATVHSLTPGTSVSIDTLGMTIEILRVDKLAMVWGYIFNIAAFLAMLFAWHVKDTLQQVAAPIYAGAAIGAVFVGDLVSLFVFWELTAIASVFLIFATRTPSAYRTGMRYLLIQVGSGVILLSGVLIWYATTGSIDFDHIGIETLSGKLIFIAFGIKCAFPLLHNWLQDSYPKATITGTVVLSAFTTKLAIYALARGFAGTEYLIYVGATMAVFPIFYAMIENDLRRVLAYSLNDQLGFMVVGVGIGTEMALNGTAAHAFTHILYKALLFMAIGAVMFRVGSAKCTNLGGLYKSMPWTTGFCIVGAMSISAFPLFSGFVSKSMILTAIAEEHRTMIWAIMLLASASVLLHTGLKVPYFAFFGRDSGHRVKEAPWNMIMAMGLTAVLCIAVGVYPDALYDLLPYTVNYEPYTVAHVIQQLQVLGFAALVFGLAILYRVYPRPMNATHLDTDWLYRKLLPKIVTVIGKSVGRMDRALRSEAHVVIRDIIGIVERQHGPNSHLSGAIHAGTMALVVVSVLLLFLLVTIF